MLLVSFMDMITNPLVIASVILAALGMAISLLAKKIVKCKRKVKEVDPADKLLLGLKITGLTMVLIAFILLFAWGLGGIFN